MTKLRPALGKKFKNLVLKDNGSLRKNFSATERKGKLYAKKNQYKDKSNSFLFDQTAGIYLYYFNRRTGSIISITKENFLRYFEKTLTCYFFL